MRGIEELRSLEDCRRVLKGRERRKIAYETWLEKWGERSYVVRFRGTAVVWYKGDEVVLRTGGWKTAVTKRRMNQFSPVRVWQEDWKWYWEWRGWSGEWEEPCVVVSLWKGK